MPDWGTRSRARGPVRGSFDVHDATQPIVNDLEVELAIAQLRLPDPCTLADVHRHVEQVRQRSIEIDPYPVEFLEEFDRLGKHLPSGMVIDTETGWQVLYRPDTSAAHQLGIVAHEIGHVLLLHNIAGASPLMRATGVVDHASLEVAAKRTVYESPIERAAERFSRTLVDDGLLRTDRHGQPERIDWYRSILEG